MHPSISIKVLRPPPRSFFFPRAPENQPIISLLHIRGHRTDKFIRRGPTATATSRTSANFFPTSLCSMLMPPPRWSSVKFPHFRRMIAHSTVGATTEKRERTVGSVSAEKEVNVPASVAWNKAYGTLQLAKIIEQALPNAISKVHVLEGDGAVGTVFHVVFAPGEDGSTKSQKEIFTVVDDEKRVKVAEVYEGGYLDLGFTKYNIRFEVIEKTDQSCITKATIEYEVPDEAAAKADCVSIQPLVDVMEAAANYLLQNHNN